MYRCRLAEIIKEKGISNKQLSDESGVSTDTISRIIHPENPEKTPLVSIRWRIYAKFSAWKCGKYFTWETVALLPCKRRLFLLKPSAMPLSQRMPS